MVDFVKKKILMYIHTHDLETNLSKYSRRLSHQFFPSLAARFLLTLPEHD